MWLVRCFCLYGIVCGIWYCYIFFVYMGLDELFGIIKLFLFIWELLVFLSVV